MVLRFVLVSLVASLGFELPHTADLSRWIDSSRTWLSAQVKVAKVVGDDVIEVVEVEDNTNSPTPAAEARAVALDSLLDRPESARRVGDALSIEVVDLEEEPAMILPEIASERPAVESEPEILALQKVPDRDAAFESIVRDMAASFADETSLTVEIEPALASVDKSEETGPEVAGTESRLEAQKLADKIPARLESEPSRKERLGMAVKLTGQAIQAWMGVL
ncbi:MAG TPA: hypothetical protein VFT74_08345, partial [Isosphaeraceae bacterium]|nr:hypothetical protein [Isosphaeraceae bacterium]